MHEEHSKVSSSNQQQSKAQKPNQNQSKPSSRKKQIKPQERIQSFRKDVNTSAGDQYMIALSGRLGRIQNQMIKDFHLNKKFSFKFPKFSQDYTKQIAQQILKQLTKEKNEIQGEQKQELVKNLGGDVHNVIKSILTEIQPEKQNNIGGDFDIIFNSEMPQNCSQEIISQLKEQIQKDNEMVYNFWILKDYLETDKKVEGDKISQSNAIHVFQLKRNPFINSSETRTLEKIMKEQTIKKVRNALKTTKSPDIKTYSQRFIYHCLQNNMLFNISQLIKILYASVNEIYKDEFKNLSYLQIAREMRSEGSFNYRFELSRKSHPKIIMYYVINNKMQEKDVLSKFQFFKPFLKHFFRRERAVLHLIGFSEKNENEELKKLIKLMMDKINSLQKQMQAMKKREKKEEI